MVDVDRSHLYECNTVQGTHAFHSVRTLDNAIVEMWTEKSLVFVIHVAVVNGTTVNPHIGLTVGIMYQSPLVKK